MPDTLAQNCVRNLRDIACKPNIKKLKDLEDDVKKRACRRQLGKKFSFRREGIRGWRKVWSVEDDKTTTYRVNQNV